jgi:hypothetical protein
MTVSPQFAFVAICVNSVIYITGITAYFRKRRKFPISQRFPRIVTIELINVSLSGLLMVLQFYADEDSVFRNCEFYLMAQAVSRALFLTNDPEPSNFLL